MDSLTIDIRPAELEDAIFVSDTHRQAWSYAYDGLLPYKSMIDMFERRDLDWWKRAISGTANVMVLDVGGDIAGYATMGGNRVSDLSQEGEIYELYLRPEYMGIGLGRRLFEDAQRMLKSRGHQGCLVWTLKDNTGAVDFYQAMGGKQVARGHEVFNGERFAKVAYAWN